MANAKNVVKKKGGKPLQMTKYLKKFKNFLKIFDKY
jgi:hypothetical protein